MMNDATFTNCAKRQLARLRQIESDNCRADRLRQLQGRWTQTTAPVLHHNLCRLRQLCLFDTDDDSIRRRASNATWKEACGGIGQGRRLAGNSYRPGPIGIQVGCVSDVPRYD